MAHFQLYIGPAMKNIDLHESSNTPFQFVQYFNPNIMQTNKHARSSYLSVEKIKRRFGGRGIAN